MNDILPPALAFAPSGQRAAVTLLFDLDARLGQIIATTTEPMVGQMRLTWWHDRLSGWQDGGAAHEPLLQGLGGILVRGALTGIALAELVEGWEAALNPLPLTDEDLRLFGRKRGDVLFHLAARLLNADIRPGMGAGWALIDFAMRCSDAMTRARAILAARQYLIDGPIVGPKTLRILAHVAKSKSNCSNDEILQPVRRRTLLSAVLRS